MKSFLLLLLLYHWQFGTFAQKCSNPQVLRRTAFIYKTVPLSRIQVVECLYSDGNPKNNYYDITNNCVTAASTGVFIDKYGDSHQVRGPGSKVTLQTHYVDADTAQNVIFLPSGKKCRYDAGFCYDPSKGGLYAVVWNVGQVSKAVCPTQLQQIFFGYTDFWTFPAENKQYLVYSVPSTDLSFSVSLSNATTCHGHQAWYVEDQGFLVSYTRLLPGIQSTPKLDQRLFPTLKSKGDISDSIIRDCTLKSYSLDFNTKIDTDYLSDSGNLKSLLKFYQQNIEINRNAINKLSRDIHNNNGVKGASENVLSELNKLKSTINTNFNNIQKLFGDINKLKTIDADFESTIETLSRSVRQLKLDIKNCKAENAGVQKQLNEFQKDINQKVLNVDNRLKTELNKLSQSSGSDVINRLNPTIESIKQSSMNCLNTINNVKKDTGDAIQKLQNELKQNQASLEKNVGDIILKNLTNIEMVVNKKLNDAIAPANQKCTQALNEVTSFRNMIRGDVTTLERKLDKCNVDQKATADQLKKAEQAFSNRISSTANDLQGLRESLYNYVNMSIAGVTDSSNKNLSKEITDLKASISIRLSRDETNLKNVENNLQKLRNEFNQKGSSLDAAIQAIKTDVTALQGPNPRLAQAIEAGILQKVIPLLNPTLITDKVTRDLNQLKGVVAAQNADSDKKIVNLEKEIDSCKSVSGNKLKENDNKIGQVESNLSKTQTALNDLSNKFNDGFLKQLNNEAKSAVDKSTKCETEVKQLKNELNKLKKEFVDTVAALRAEHVEFRNNLGIPNPPTVV